MNAKQIKLEPIKTVLVITVGMLLVFLISKIKYFLYVALGVGILGLSSTYLANQINYLWMKLTSILSLIIPNIILSIFFFLILTPLALLSRIFDNKNQISLKNNTSTLFKDYTKPFDKESFKKPW